MAVCWLQFSSIMCGLTPKGRSTLSSSLTFPVCPPLLIHNSQAARFHKWGKSSFKRMAAISSDLLATQSPEEACNCSKTSQPAIILLQRCLKCCHLLQLFIQVFKQINDQKINILCVISAIADLNKIQHKYTEL